MTPWDLRTPLTILYTSFTLYLSIYLFPCLLPALTSRPHLLFTFAIHSGQKKLVQIQHLKSCRTTI